VGATGATGTTGLSGQQTFSFIGPIGTPATPPGNFALLFHHGGLELWARCRSRSTPDGPAARLELRAYNYSTHNAVIKLFSSEGSHTLTSDSDPTGDPGNTDYAASGPNESTLGGRYTEDDQFGAREIWDFNSSFSSFKGPNRDVVGLLVYADDTSSAVTVDFLAHTFKGTGFTGSPSSRDEAPFAAGTNVNCVFSGQALYPPGT
jgi:hypothetical protein